ncbi:hypothetical protein CFAEC_08695 [Corynebacterium faecale]|uniref:hypothetical protein n=1 Tax=Corynebacterium faecale TaxID=1758466 RepID=UPI0025B406D4|nr:hypothetical protein [Corynebacterium faecale]WJY92556.1 hypothetical protein CFAEC_08695 [Corynebacterium faecale]
MTGTLLKLQGTMWKRTVSGNNAAITMIVLVSIYGLIGLLSFMVLLGQGLSEGSMGILAGIVASGTIAYAIAAIMWPSGEGQLAPSSFAIMPLAARDILPAMAVATLMQSRGILAVICTVTTAVVALLIYPPVMIPVVWVMLACALVMTLLLGELVSSLGSSSSSRVSRERTSLYASLGFMLVIVAYQLMTSQGASTHVDTFGQIVRWTPFASAAGVIEAVAAGHWVMAAVFFVLTGLYLGLGIRLWVTLINRALTAPLDNGATSVKERKAHTDPRAGRLIPAAFPLTPFWAVYFRSLVYLVRDSRLLTSLIMFPMLAAIFLVQSFTIESFIIYLGLIILAIFGGAVATNDFGYDGPSTWLNIVSGASSRTLLMGRHLAHMTPVTVGVLLFAILTLVIGEDAYLSLLIIVIAVGVLATTAGIALAATTFNPFATAKPGTSPWGDRSGYSGAAFVSAFATMLLGWIPSLPAIILTIFGYSAGVTWAVVLGQLLALALPGAFYALMIRLCSRRVDAGMPEIFNKVKSHVG